MNLLKKKELAARMLKVGKKRIIFVKERVNEIKEAITKQDIRDLKNEGAIIVKEIKGSKRNIRKSKKRGPGKIRKSVNKRKREYVVITRKLRKYLFEINKQGKISKEDFKDMRKKIRNRFFRTKSQIKEYIANLRKWKQ